MQIQLQKVRPVYLEAEKINTSQIWGKEIILSKGEHLYIIAPSGSGKTSLVHFIYGLRKDYTGAVCFDNKNINSFSLENLSAFRQKNISVIFQDLRLFDEQTVLENLEIKRRLNPYHPKEQVIEMAKYLGIENKLGNVAKTCSYGEQQRIAIIRSLLQPFDFLLLDEPFSHLDDVNRVKAFNLIKEECSQRKASMVFADLKRLDFFNDERILRL